ncbi:MAG: hypothetical protein IKF97_00675 [Clostridia bacterium]|nr:hypothetical protein [Clostridia bacterium]
MQKKKESFLDKVIKKNYNNELEHVLENKDFDINVKNILLSIMYKLETAYNDYAQVKKNVMPKDQYLQMIINIIKKDIDSITLVKMDSEEAIVLGKRTFIVDKEKKNIICYPIERKLLYAITKINKKDKIIKDKYFVLNQTLSDLLNVGNNINTVEVMRDFNGFSWAVITKDIESVEHNLIYQNLRILVGAEFLNKWIHNKEFIIDYYESFTNKLEDLYGKQLSKKILDSLAKLSVMLEAKYSKEKIEHLINSKKEIEQKLDEIKNKEVFIKELTQEKKELNKKIKDLDTVISDKELLQKEYDSRNESLPLDKKIFSMRVLAKMLKEDRQNLMEQKERINKLLNPQKFVKYKSELEDKYQYIKYIDNQNLDAEIQKELTSFQQFFIKCGKLKVKNAKTTVEISELLSQFRYYLNIPINRKENIYGQNILIQDIIELTKMLINKAVETKTIINISTNKEINYLILKNIFESKIINLENVNIELIKEEECIYLQTYDEEVFDEKYKIGTLSAIDINSLTVKFNKKIKLFTN